MRWPATLGVIVVGAGLLAGQPAPDSSDAHTSGGPDCLHSLRSVIIEYAIPADVSGPRTPAAAVSEFWAAENWREPTRLDLLSLTADEARYAAYDEGRPHVALLVTVGRLGPAVWGVRGYQDCATRGLQRDPGFVLPAPVPAVGNEFGTVGAH